MSGRRSLQAAHSRIRSAPVGKGVIRQCRHRLTEDDGCARFHERRNAMPIVSDGEQAIDSRFNSAVNLCGRAEGPRAIPVHELDNGLINRLTRHEAASRDIAQHLSEDAKQFLVRGAGGV